METGEKNEEDVRIARNLLSESSSSIRQFLDAIRNHPLDLQDFLSLAEDDCAMMSRSMDVDIHLDLHGFGPIEHGMYVLEQGDDLLAILEEAIVNTVRHSGQKSAKVRLGLGEHFEMEIRDKGRGFDLETTPSGNGLQSITTRALSIGADYSISSDMNGTRVLVRLPVTALMAEGNSR